MFDLIIIAYNISNAEKTDAVFLIELLWHCKGEMAIEKKKSPLSESQIKRMDRVGKEDKNMAPKYKVTYFNFTGLGEPIRYLLAYGNFDFEDNRFEMADWPKIKPTTPFGQVPFLEVDGKVINQSSAICRYLAKQCGLAGKSDWDALEADAVVDTITDFRLQYSAYFKAPNEEAKAKQLEDVRNIHNPNFLSKFEEKVKKNGGHFVNNQLTWADIYFAAVTELMAGILKEPVLDKYPNLKALKEKVEAIPNIAAYREKRPKTMF
ncbi:hypothetical protein RUM44_004542 [Polyplax serrata]|uniref:glutathione transferase n=1 Tax=Polyplax serrata TaxID=468196 RepID=A0ABR1B363_POLSC